jgi:hypothetical protein
MVAWRGNAGVGDGAVVAVGGTGVFVGPAGEVGEGVDVADAVGVAVAVPAGFVVVTVGDGDATVGEPSTLVAVAVTSGAVAVAVASSPLPPLQATMKAEPTTVASTNRTLTTLPPHKQRAGMLSRPFARISGALSSCGQPSRPSRR